FLVGRVVDERGAPIADAEVSYGGSRLSSWFRGAGARGAGRGGAPWRGGRGRDRAGPGLANLAEEVVSVRAKSGADGSFRLEQPSRTEGVELRVDHPEFVVFTRSDLILPAVGLDVGTIRLAAGGTVSGYVYGPGGAKLAGAEVSLLDPPSEERGRGFFSFSFGLRGERRTTTDEEGRFRLTGMPAGKAVVEASATGLVRTTSDAIEVVAHQAVGEVVLHLEKGFTLAGTIRDGAGKPVAEASVSVNAANDWIRLIRTGGEPDWITGEDGKYEISGLRAGAQTVAVTAEGFARHETSNVDPAQTATLDITLGATLFVAGRVQLKGSPDAPGDVKVQLVPHWGREMGVLGGGAFLEQDDRENKTDVAGEFRIDGVEPGDYRIVARAAGTTRGQSEPFKIEDGKSVEGLVIEVERAATVSGRVLDPGGAPIAAAAVRLIEPRPAQADSVAELALGAAIRISDRGGMRPTRLNFDGRRTLGRATTDGEGRYSVDHLGPGNFDVELTHADFAMTVGEVKELLASEQRSGVDFRMNRGGTIEGAIIAVDGTPRPGDRVNVRSKTVPAASLSAVADANGNYRVDHVPAGEATATREESNEGNGPGDFAFVIAGIGSENDESAGKTVLVEEGGTVRVDFSQQEKPLLEGVVTCADGPVAGATVTATEDSGGGGGRGIGGRGFPGLFGPRKEATTGPDGRYRLADLSPGTWRISARHPQGLVATDATIALAAGTPARHDFALEGGVIEGRAVQAGGKTGIASAVVTLERVSAEGGGNNGEVANMIGAARLDFVVEGNAGGGRAGRTFRLGGDNGGTRVSTATDGTFRIPWVPAGKYRVRISHPEHLAANSADIELASDAVVRDVEVAMALAARLKVHVRSKATGQPVANVAVTLSMPPDGRAFAMTDDQGTASFDSLIPGSWSATVRDTISAPGRGRRGGGGEPGPGGTIHCEAGLIAETTIDQ
ncbi:MAG: hypothetical protein FJ293_15415, partial [Planctomycetes bacterium]|nr:hypothetical protein [Planctomycetota bacterium]